MTGYGRGGSRLGEGRVEVELRSLNHRFLEVRFRAPRALADLGVEIEQLARSRLRRGRLDVQVTLEGATGYRATLDRELAREALRALVELRDELSPGEPVPLTVLTSVPDLFVPVRSSRAGPVTEAVRSAFTEAVDRLDEMRATEGAALARDLSGRLATIRTLAAALRRRAPEVVAHLRTRMRERTTRLLAESLAALDNVRLEQEIAILADRADVTEELTRLESHCNQIERLLAAEDEVGRRMEFLLQELSREANTIGAKSQDAESAQLVVDLKVEIERMREQSQNVE